MNDNYSVTNHEQKNANIRYKIKCECGEEATVRITPDGVSTSGKINYTEASWNSNIEPQKKEDEESEEEDKGLKRDNKKIQ